MQYEFPLKPTTQRIYLNKKSEKWKWLYGSYNRFEFFQEFTQVSPTYVLGTGKFSIKKLNRIIPMLHVICHKYKIS